MLAIWLLSLLGCDQLTGGGSPAAPECDLSFDTLEGRTFVYLEAMPDKSERPNPIARVKFVQEDGGLAAKYTVGSLSDVYTYPCKMKGEGDDAQLFCAEEARPTDWCQALLVADAPCTKKVLKKMGADDMPDDELNAAIKEAKDTVRKYRDTEKWRHFVLNNNNLGNKLQGRLYVNVKTERCRLDVGDYYWTIHQGKELEDTNPVGQNPFVESKDDEWSFVHCTEGGMLPGIATETLPEDLSTIPGRRTYATKSDIWFHYLGEKNIEAKEGCTYSYNSWANWKPADKGVAVTPVDGKIPWKAKHNFDKGVEPIGMAGRQVAVFTMERLQTCEGKEEVLDVVCEGAAIE